MLKPDFLSDNIVKIIKYILMIFVIFLSCNLILKNNNNLDYFIISLIGSTTFIIFDQVSPSIHVNLSK
jgi:hypothetical protein